MQMHNMRTIETKRVWNKLEQKKKIPNISHDISHTLTVTSDIMYALCIQRYSIVCILCFFFTHFLFSLPHLIQHLERSYLIGRFIEAPVCTNNEAGLRSNYIAR